MYLVVCYVLLSLIWRCPNRSFISSLWTAVNSPIYLFSIVLSKGMFLQEKVERGLWYWCVLMFRTRDYIPAAFSLNFGVLNRIEPWNHSFASNFSVMNKTYYFKSLCLHITKCIELPLFKLGSTRNQGSKIDR